MSNIIIQTSKDMSNSKYRIVDIVLYYFAAFILPNIFLFDLYNRNRIQNHLPFNATIILAIILAIVSVGILSLLRWAAKSLEGALVVTSILWLMFWLFEQIYSIVLNYAATLSRLMLLTLIVIGLILVAVYFRRYNPSFAKISPVFRILAVTLCGLFIFNFIPGLHSQILLQRGMSLRYQAFLRGEVIFYLKQDFNIDPSLPSPDIYWFHMDGMMSLEVVERFFGESQDALRTELANRGFIIYKDAFLNAGGTAIAHTALFSPAFYDSYYGERLSEVSHLFLTPRGRALSDRLAQDGLHFRDDIMPDYEMFRVFREIGYEAVTINFIHDPVRQKTAFDRIYNMYDIDTPLTFNDNYNDNNLDFTNSWNRFWAEADSLVRLMRLATPIAIIPEQIIAPVIYISAENDEESQWLPVPDHTEAVDRLVAYTVNINDPLSLRFERQKYRMLIDSLTISSPKIVYIQLNYTHAHWWHMHNPYVTWGAVPMLELYPRAHDYAAIAMLNSIDIILEQNPNTVIVLQSDHGIHCEETKEYLLSVGYTEEQVLELYLSVFSAVRIPPEYGGLDFPLEPRNISRELVNRFVGENYTLLPDRYRN